MVISNVSVITSYSIHYTKLYDQQRYSQEDIFRGFDLNDILRQFGVGGSGQSANFRSSMGGNGRFNRITSYNVCYTKLLRFKNTKSILGCPYNMVSTPINYMIQFLKITHVTKLDKFQA